MKITELKREKRPLDNPDGYYSDHVGQSLDSKFQFIKDLPDLNGYKLKLYRNTSTKRYELIAFDNSGPIAIISSHNVDISTGLKQIFMSRVKSGYQGNGLGIGLYKALINEFGGLLSDYSLTSAGQNLWKALYKDPSINVMKYHLYDRKAYPILNLDDLNKTFGTKNVLLLAQPK